MSKGTAAKDRRQPRISIAVEFVGVIAILCLLAGGLIGRYTAPAQAEGGSAVADSIQATLEEIRQETNHDKLVQMGNRAYDDSRGLPEVAIHAYEKALSFQSDDPDVLSDLAAMYITVGQPDRAVQLARKATEIDPKHVGSWLWLGNALGSTGDKVGARKAYQQALKAAPDSDFAKDAERMLAGLEGKP